MQVRKFQAGETLAQPNKQLMRASHILDPTLPGKIEDLMKKNTELKNVDGKPEDPHSHSHIEKKQVGSNITPYILLVALSFHGFFEGIALGLQGSNKQALFFFIAIISHKWAESFTLGISFNKAQIEKSTFVKLISLFSIFTPCGAVLGLILSQSSKVIEAIFLALSAGIQ
jgi:zinc transporter ZupT